MVVGFKGRGNKIGSLISEAKTNQTLQMRPKLYTHERIGIKANICARQNAGHNWANST
jgi:hypothetical protein